MGFEDFVISNFEGLSVSSAVLLLAFAILRNSRADSKDRTDIDKAQIQLSQSILKDGADRTDAIKENTAALRENSAANLTAHQTTHTGLAALGTRTQGIEDTQASMNEIFRNFLADFSKFETSVSSTITEFREKAKADAKEFAAIGLQMSAMKNSISELITKLYPSPRETQEISEEIQIEARITSGVLPAPEINPT